MIKIYKIIVLVLLFNQVSFAQLTGYKHNVTKQIFDNIVLAYGSNKTAPILEIKPKNNPGPKNILMYYPGVQSKIVMDEEVYDICSNLGKDSTSALASMLGHELAHHFEKHDWCSSFAYLLDEKQELKQKLTKINKEEKLRLEAEADYYGGFYGYVAGYTTYDVSSKLLDKIYSHYKLSDNLQGYPSKEERKQIAAQTLKKLEQYQAVFDAGEIMFCLKEYETAATCFEYLADKFPSREMFGNTGLIKVLASMDYLTDKSMPFALPLEFDAGSRLKLGVVRGNNVSIIDQERIRKQLLADAIKYFDKAINIDPDYNNALINKGCAYVLLQNYEMAAGISNNIISQGKGKHSSNNISKAYTLRAITLYLREDKEKAHTDFEQAKQLWSTSRNNYNYALSAERNKNIFDVFVDYVASYFYEEMGDKKKAEKAINPSLEKISNELAFQFVSDKENLIKIPSNKFIEISFVKNEGFTGLVVKAEKTYKILITGSDYKGKSSQGISKGDDLQNVLEKYGDPTYTLDETKGKYLIYRKSRIGYLLNHANKVTKWFTYY